MMKFSKAWSVPIACRRVIAVLTEIAMSVWANKLFTRLVGGGLLLLCSLDSYAWYDNAWNYRVPINVPAGATVNSTIEVNVDFAALLTTLGVAGTLDVNSPRVVRSDDLSLSTTQEFTDTLYNGATDAAGNGRGEIKFLLQDAGATTYYLYFDIAANGPKAVNPQTPINGNFEQGTTGTQNPPGWTATKANNNFDAQVRPSESPTISDGSGTPGSVTTDGTPLTGAFSYLLGGRTNAEAVDASPSVTLTRSIVVPATSPGNLVVSYRLEGWDSSDNGATRWDFLRIRLVGSTTTEIVGPTYGNYVTYPFSPNKGTGGISSSASGYGRYNYWDMSSDGTHRSGMTLAAGSQPWFTRTFALSPYAGQTITLQITMNEATAYKSWVHVDDVEWSVVAATLGTPAARSLLHHVEIQHGSGAGVTCSPSTLTIRACQDAACTTLYTGGVSGTLSASGTPTVNWSGGTGFSIAAGNSSVTKNVQVTTPGSVVFSTSLATTCNFGSPACTFTAADSGFVFDVLNHVSEVSQTFNVSAVKKSDSSLACVPAFANVSKSVTFTCGYTNPSSGTLPVRVGGSALNASNSTAAACDATGRAVSLSFNGSGVASTTAQYADVGQMTLNARYAPTTGTEAGLVMTGTDTFIAAPSTFGFSSITAAPIKAGKTFSATVTALNAAATPAATPNFGKETTPEGVTLSYVRVQPTGTGAVDGSFTGSVGSFSGGSASGSNLTWSEVGKINLKATLASGSSPGYLGSGLTATGTSANVGAFVPDHFDTIVTLGCSSGSFTYSAQPFGLVVNAMNGAATPAVTKNYDGTVNTNPNFANLVTLSDANASGVGTLAPTTIALTAFSAGQASITPAYTFTSAKTAPTTIKLRAVDANASSSTGAEGTNPIRSGRVRLMNAYGSELLDLPVTMRAEYWNNNAWAINAADSCTGDTTLDINNAVTITLSNITLDPAKTCVWDSASPGLSGAGCSTAGTAGRQYREGATPGIGFVGDFNLWLKASGSGNSGTVGVTATVPSWLRYNWAGVAANPSARATFGIYKTPIIYMRENY